jgi:hypothetical protein
VNVIAGLATLLPGLNEALGEADQINVGVGPPVELFAGVKA